MLSGVCVSTDLAGLARRVVPVVLNGAGQPLDVGRATRVIPDGLRRAVAARDRGCARCGRPPSWCETHHLIPWEHGGPTDTWNLVLLCREHHRGVHHRHFTISGNPDHRHHGDNPLVFREPGGRRIGPLPPHPPDGPVADAATGAGITDPQWSNRSGERGDWDHISWHDPNRDTWLAQHRTN